MVLSFEQTKVLIAFILKANPDNARSALRMQLDEMDCQEPKFYASVIEHGPGMQFKSDEWFDFLSKIPNHMLRAERRLMDKLSPGQFEKLPPATIG